jgi:protein-arginine kinase activator protein McsA
LAVRFDTPIYTYDRILDEAGLQMDENMSKIEGAERKKAKSKIPSHQNDLMSMSVDDLQVLLQEVLDSEDYIRAAQIRDEINSRK